MHPESLLGQRQNRFLLATSRPREEELARGFERVTNNEDLREPSLTCQGSEEGAQRDPLEQALTLPREKQVRGSVVKLCTAGLEEGVSEGGGILWRKKETGRESLLRNNQLFTAKPKECKGQLTQS